ncbi:MAG: glycoside hydrolase family 3 C-terminal domain-containing protein [Eubacteriales bacterium]|nr:glycoside hydrolase family 3 C-terminal domain-containing protein [Eubacteriales bacterium]
MMNIYKDPTASVPARADDLMARMSFEQKIDQITCLVTITPDIPDFKQYVPNGIGNVGAFSVASSAQQIAEYSYRLQKFLVEETELGIPALIHCEAAAGAQFSEANVFPSAISQSSTFDIEKIGRMASLIKNQMYAVGFRQALSPVFDVARDARWGRITETYGEDPTLTAAMGSAFVRGLQDMQDRTRGIAATAKHFVGHGVTEGGLNMGRNLVTERELEEVHCKPFQAAISEGGLMGIMNSYCSMNGEPIACSNKLLTDLLRGRLGFAGFVVSDYISIDRIVDPFCVASTYEEAGIKALKAGLDVEYPRPKGYTYALKGAVERGDIDMATIDRAVRRVLTAKFTLGLFEQPYPDTEMLKCVLHTKEADELNLTLAKEAVTLLKNEHGALPLCADIRKIAVIGPHGDSVRSYFAPFSYPAALDMTISRDEDGQGWEEPGLIIYDIRQQYVGQIRETTPRVEKRIRDDYRNVKPLWQAVAERAPQTTVSYAKGINYAGTDVGGIDEALAVAAEADVVILTLGGKNGWGVTSTVGEGVDSTDIDLPGRQEEFARAVFALHRKTVVVHFDGRPLSNCFVASHFDAIVEAWQLGEFGGQALAAILFGDANPSGRLPITAARNAGQLPVYYSLPRGSGYVSTGHTGMIRNTKGYINDTAKPLYCFGHGLSYTTFAYRALTLSEKEIAADGKVTATIVVENTGNRDGAEVVQLYVTDTVASMVRPTLELLGFNRVHVKAGKAVTVMFEVEASGLAFLDADMNWRVEAGEFVFKVGGASDRIEQTAAFTVKNTKIIDGKTRAFYARVK